MPTKANGNASDGEVAYADGQIGRLLDALNARIGPTIIAVAGDHGESLGDHGESLGDHGEQTHGMLVYDSTLRVPMILVGPGFAVGAHDPTPRSLLDLGHRLLTASGLEAASPSAEMYAESVILGVRVGIPSRYSLTIAGN